MLCLALLDSTRLDSARRDVLPTLIAERLAQIEEQTRAR